jgi:hypothetical protein
VHESEEFRSKIISFDEATFKLNGTINHHRCVYWTPENPHIYVDKAIRLPGLSCVDCSFLKEQLLALCILTCFGHPFYLPFLSSVGIRHFTFNMMEHHHQDIRSYLDENLPSVDRDKEVVLSIPHDHLICLGGGGGGP